MDLRCNFFASSFFASFEWNLNKVRLRANETCSVFLSKFLRQIRKAQRQLNGKCVYISCTMYHVLWCIGSMAWIHIFNTIITYVPYTFLNDTIVGRSLICSFIVWVLVLCVFCLNPNSEYGFFFFPRISLFFSSYECFFLLHFFIPNS